MTTTNNGPPLHDYSRALHPDSASRFTDFDIESVGTGKNEQQQRPSSRKTFAGGAGGKRRIPYLHSTGAAQSGQGYSGVGRFGGDQFIDYEQRYPQDEYGKEMGPNARVWHVYLDEADKYDVEMISGFKDTTDVLLVFAGLFSAVVTTFVVQASQALQPDYAQITASLLTELVGLQRALATGTSISDVPVSALNVSSDTTSPIDRWVNGLWFTSLSFALTSALIAVLVKQWLQHYISALSGTPRDRVLLRHFRFKGLNKWRIPVIVDLLPILLHISLFMFFAGLALFIWPMDITVTSATIAISGSAYSFYMLTNILSFIFPDCAYKNPVSQFLQQLHLGKRARHFFQNLRRRSVFHTTVPISHQDWDDYAHATSRMDELLAEALVWLRSSSSNPSGIKIVSQAVAGIPFNFSSSHILQQSLIQNSVEREFNACFDPNTDMLLPNMSGKAEALFRSLTVTGTSLSEYSLLTRIQKLEESLVKTAHPRRLSIKAVSIIAHRYFSPNTRTYTTTSLYESLLLLLYTDVELPPSLWERLFCVLMEQSISGTLPLSQAYHHAHIPEKHVDFVGQYGHHACAQRAQVIITLVHMLSQLTENDYSTFSSETLTDSSWVLPGNISLSALCQSERGMTLLILKYLSHHLVYGDSHALALHILEQCSDEEALSLRTEILIHSLRFVLSLLQMHSQHSSFFSGDGDILTSFQQTLFDMAAKSPISVRHSILLETMHRFGEFSIEIEGIERSIPRLIRLLDIDNLNDNVQPMVSRSSLMVLTRYYIENVLSHPWPSTLTESDAGVLLNRLFAVQDMAVYDTLRELDGLNHFRRCFPIDFTSESIWMQSFYPWMAKAFTHYVRFLTTVQNESIVDLTVQKQHLEEIFEPNALSWFLWLQLFIDGPGPVDGIVSALSKSRLDDLAWKSAIKILVDTLHRDAALYGTWNTTPNSGPWIPTKSYRSLRSIIHHVYRLSDDDSEWALYQYVTVPHFEDNEPDMRARFELRIEGELVYGPYAIKFAETDSDPNRSSLSVSEVAPRRSSDDRESLRQRKDWINRVSKSLNGVLRTTSDEISLHQVV